MPLNIKGRRGSLGIGFKETIQSSSEQSVSTSSSGTYLIELETFGIREGLLGHEAPYSENEWKMAYDNFEGIKSALQYAHDEGYSVALLPRGNYNVCLQNPEAKEILTTNRGWEIKIPSNLTFDMNGSTIKTIYDSNNKNPYDLSSNEPWQLMGSLFVFSQVENSKITNGELIGDRYERSYSNVDERSMEQTYGIRNQDGSKSCEINNMKIHGFMGDGINAVGSPNYSLGGNMMWGDNTLYAGEVDDSGVLVARDGAYSTDFVEISVDSSEEIILTGYAYARYPTFNERYCIISWYTDSNVFISQEVITEYQSLKMPVSARKFKLTIFNEVVGEESIVKRFSVSPVEPNIFTIKNCDIFNNNRGGISNMLHNTIIENNRIYNNGMGTKEGWDTFPDTTRYSINCEDSISSHVTIRNNEISGGFHGILCSGVHVDISNNNIFGLEMTAISLYHIRTASVENNFIKNCSNGFGMSSDGNTRKRFVKLSGNIFEDVESIGVSGDKGENTQITMCNNTHKAYNHTFNVTGLDLFELNGHVMEDGYNYHNIYSNFELISDSPLKNCTVRLKESQHSTSSFKINSVAGSSIVVDITDEDRRIELMSEVNGLTVSGGRIYKVESKHETGSYKIKDCVFDNIKEVFSALYGLDVGSETNLTYTFENCEFSFNSTEESSFFITSNNTDGEANVKFIFNNCIIETGESATSVFDIRLSGSAHNTTIEMNNTTIDTTNSVGSVNLCNRSGTPVNDSVFNFNNVVELGSLTKDNNGYEINDLTPLENIQKSTPTSATDNGKKGDIAFDDNFVYCCIEDNQWKRSPLSTW